MVQHKHFKSRVRERMARTGESYTTARMHLLRSRPDAAELLETGAHPEAARRPEPGGRSVPAETVPVETEPAVQYDAALWQGVMARSGVVDPATGVPFTEAMLAGLAGGIGFMVATFDYAQLTTATVVLRAHPEPYTDRLLERTGVPLERTSTTSARVATAALESGLDAGRDVVVRVTHGALPWVGAGDPASDDGSGTAGDDGSGTASDVGSGTAPEATDRLERSFRYADSIDVVVVGREPDGTYLIEGGGPNPGEESGDDADPRRATPGELASARAARTKDRHWAAWISGPEDASAAAAGAGAGGTGSRGGDARGADARGAEVSDVETDGAGRGVAGSGVAGSVVSWSPCTEDQLAAAVRAAVAETTGRLLGTLPLEGIPAGWSAKFGVAGMRTWAGLLRDGRTKKGWPALFADETRLRTGLGMVQGFLAGSRWGGSGGLRGLYADFLTEAAGLPGLGRLADVAPVYRELAGGWDALADAVDPEIPVDERAGHFALLAGLLDGLAEREEAAARALAEATAATG